MKRVPSAHTWCDVAALPNDPHHGIHTAGCQYHPSKVGVLIVNKTFPTEKVFFFLMKDDLFQLERSCKVHLY